MEFKKFNMSVVSPHEAFMALNPSVFPWESKIITDYNELLDRLSPVEKPEELLTHEFEQELVHVSVKNRELVPIFSSMVIEKYEQFTYKGLQVDL